MRPALTTLRNITIFAAGLALGYAIQPVRAQREDTGSSSIAWEIAVPNLDEGIRFYTRALGAKEAITVPRRPRTTVLVPPAQPRDISRAAGNARRPDAGLVARRARSREPGGPLPTLKEGRLEVGNPSESARTKALIAQATGPNGMKFELLEFGPDSVQRKVMNAWKYASATARRRRLVAGTSSPLARCALL